MDIQAKILSNEFVLTEGDLITCNIDGREEKFLVHIKHFPKQMYLRNVNGRNHPLNIYIGEVIKTFKDNA